MAEVVVIGGGVGGMAAAIRLAARGHHVRLFESRAELGGKLAEIRRDGFTFGVGPSLLTLPAAFEELAAEAGLAWPGLADLAPVDPLCRYLFADGSVLEAPGDPAMMSAAVDRLAPGQGAAWRRYYTWGERAWSASERSFLAGPPGLAGAAWADTHLSDLAAIAPARTLAGNAARFFSDPRLVQYACRYATYSGSSPYLAPAALGCIPYLEHAHGGWYVAGGLVRLRDALARMLTHTGVQVHTGVRVTRILTSNERHTAGTVHGNERAGWRPAHGATGGSGPRASGYAGNGPAASTWRGPGTGRVTGVIADGQTVRADIVVAAADAGNLYRELLPCPSRLRRIGRLGPSSSAFLAVCAVRGRTPGLAHHNVIFSADYRAEFADIFHRHRPPADPTIYLGCSAVQEPGQAPPGHENWVILVNVPPGNLASWRGAAAPYLTLVLDRLATAGLDARDRILFADTLTPRDFAARYGAWQGAIYGTAHNGRLAPLRRPGNRGPVRGLYLAGGSVHPGGGLPLVVIGSRIVADLVDADFPVGAVR